MFITALAQNIQNIIQEAENIPANMLSEAIRGHNLDTLLNITAQANDASWKVLQKMVYEELLNKQSETGFWKGILEKILATENNVLRTRLLEDENFLKLFQQQKDTSVLDITDPEGEEVLLTWAESNRGRLRNGSGELFKICIHKIPSLREWGLDYAKTLGISLIFGLQLLESKMPDAMNTAKAYFNELSSGSEEEKEAILSLCDSPNKDVRAFGLDYLAQRKEQYGNQARMLEFLSEHPDAYIQAYVAEELANNTIEKPFVKRFDKEILRMKNRSRKAKEEVKERIGQTLEVDGKTLVEIAKNGSKKDKEWAIEQLAKKVLAGEEVEGFVLE